MNIKMNRAELLSAAQRAAAVASEDAPLEPLKGVLLETDAAAGTLTLTATNIETSLEQKLSCSTGEDDAVVMNAIDCYLKGKFDESGRSSLHVGTLKTLKRDLESTKIMGELCGTLMHHASVYVDQNLRRYTPDQELAAEYQRQMREQNPEDSGQA